MPDRIHTYNKKNSKPYITHASSAPTQSMFKSRPFVEQSKADSSPQQPQDFSAALVRAQRYGHQFSQKYFNEPFTSVTDTQSKLMREHPLPFRGVKTPLIQARFTPERLGDQYEQQTDRATAQVANQIDGNTQHSPEQQPTELLYELPLQRRKKKHSSEPLDLSVQPLVQRSSKQSGQDIDHNLEQLIEYKESNGQPMPELVQRKMETAFGTNFSDVQIHEGSEAKQIGALAFTQGSDIYFQPGKYQPNSQLGQKLLGHELTHVVQQRAGQVPVPQGQGVPINANPQLEAEADALGGRAAQGESAEVSGAATTEVQRKPAESNAVQCTTEEEKTLALLGPAGRIRYGSKPGTDADAGRSAVAPESSDRAQQQIQQTLLPQQPTVPFVPSSRRLRPRDSLVMLRQRQQMRQQQGETDKGSISDIELVPYVAPESPDRERLEGNIRPERQPNSKGKGKATAEEDDKHWAQEQARQHALPEQISVMPEEIQQQQQLLDAAKRKLGERVGESSGTRHQSGLSAPEPPTEEMRTPLEQEPAQIPLPPSPAHSANVERRNSDISLAGLTRVEQAAARELAPSPTHSTQANDDVSSVFSQNLENAEQAAEREQEIARLEGNIKPEKRRGAVGKFASAISYPIRKPIAIASNKIVEPLVHGLTGKPGNEYKKETASGIKEYEALSDAAKNLGKGSTAHGELYNQFGEDAAVIGETRDTAKAVGGILTLSDSLKEFKGAWNDNKKSDKERISQGAEAASSIDTAGTYTGIVTDEIIKGVQGGKASLPDHGVQDAIHTGALDAAEHGGKALEFGIGKGAASALGLVPKGIKYYGATKAAIKNEKYKDYKSLGRGVKNSADFVKSGASAVKDLSGLGSTSAASSVGHIAGGFVGPIANTVIGSAETVQGGYKLVKARKNTTVLDDLSIATSSTDRETLEALKDIQKKKQKRAAMTSSFGTAATAGGIAALAGGPVGLVAGTAIGAGVGVGKLGQWGVRKLKQSGRDKKAEIAGIEEGGRNLSKTQRFQKFFVQGTNADKSSKQKEAGNQELATNVYNMLETMHPSQHDKLLSTISLGGKKKDSAVQEVYNSVVEKYINDQVENQLKERLRQQPESLLNETGTRVDPNGTRAKIHAQLIEQDRIKILKLKGHKDNLKQEVRWDNLPDEIREEVKKKTIAKALKKR